LLLGHDVQDEGDVRPVFKEAPDPGEKAKNFAENLIYNQKVKHLLIGNMKVKSKPD
jgi:hypothetical protein